MIERRRWNVSLLSHSCHKLLGWNVIRKTMWPRDWMDTVCYSITNPTFKQTFRFVLNIKSLTECLWFGFKIQRRRKRVLMSFNKHFYLMVTKFGCLPWYNPNIVLHVYFCFFSFYLIQLLVLIINKFFQLCHTYFTVDTTVILRE